MTLHFGGQPKALNVPYRAITRFYDPSVRYLLQFDVAPTPVEAPPPSPKPRAEAKAEGGDGAEGGLPGSVSEEIVSSEPTASEAPALTDAAILERFQRSTASRRAPRPSASAWWG